MKSFVHILGLAVWLVRAGSAKAAPPVLPPLPPGLTLLDESSAERAFDGILNGPRIPFSYPDGCYAKAQKIAMILDQEGIVSGKAFVTGKIFHRDPKFGDQLWTFHVASVVLVSTPQGPLPFVMDPYLDQAVVSYADWLSQVSSDPRTQVSGEYFTNRFVYDPSEAGENPTAYDPALVQDMDTVFAELRAHL